MTIIRVFPRRTSHTPTDPLAFVGEPPNELPAADEVRISTTFTWDIPEAIRLCEIWSKHCSNISVGGPAFETIPNGFTSGLYLKEGITFTSRGCNKRCSWCLVPQREGQLQLLSPITPGYIIQDNNFLACPREHRLKVYEMLSQQKRAAVFSGGIQTTLVDDEVAAEFGDIRINSIFMAADTEYALKPLDRAIKRLHFLGRRKLRCYMLLAFNGETIEQAEKRLGRAWEIGVLPFAQLYQPPNKWINYNAEWRALARTWSRPAAMFAVHKSN